MLITETKWDKARVSVYSKEDNSLMDYGWIDMRDSIGWTLHKYDWELWINENTTVDENAQNQ